MNYDIDCQGYNEQNVCDAWWYSGNYASAFTLDDFSDMSKYYGQQLTDLFANLTTGQLLFEGALACNAEGNFGQPVNITVNAAGVNTACISQLRILTWEMNCAQPWKQYTYLNRDCEFVETSAQWKFLDENAHHVTDQSVLSVPAYRYRAEASAWLIDRGVCAYIVSPEKRPVLAYETFGCIASALIGRGDEYLGARA